MVQVVSPDAVFEEAKSIQALFERQVAATPDSVAAVCGTEAITYSELSRRSQAVANHLMHLGICREDRVALCLDRCVPLACAMIGIAKAGAAHVCVSPSLPTDRVAHIVHDADAKVLITEEQNVTRFRSRCPDCCQVIAVEDIPFDRVADEPTPNIGSDDLFNVVYTSGTTGRPKGVMITHGVVLNRLRWMASAYKLEASDVALAHRPTWLVSFATELLGPLVSGAKVVMVGDAIAKHPERLWRAMLEHRVTFIRETPVSSEWLLEQAGRRHRGKPSTLRLAFVGGERAGSEVFRRWHSTFPGTRLLTGYGLTECSVITWCEVDAEMLTGETVPVGYPAPNINVYILDEQLRQVPRGAIGEICVSGASVARGYLGQPDLTVQRFVRNPYGPSPLFRTGDYGRWLESGTLSLVGRTDRQVKVRGFRIEPDEVESALLRCSGVRTAAVVPSEQGRLVQLFGYVTGETGLNGSALRDRLREVLPDYMVPSRVEVLKAMPLLDSGKIDRAALAARSRLGEVASEPQAWDSRVEPVARAWRDVVGLTHLRLTDRFFDVGGDSLAAVMVVAQLRADLNVELDVTLLMENATLGEFVTEVLRVLRQGIHTEEPTSA